MNNRYHRPETDSEILEEARNAQDLCHLVKEGVIHKEQFASSHKGFTLTEELTLESMEELLAFLSFRRALNMSRKARRKK